MRSFIARILLMGCFVFSSGCGCGSSQKDGWRIGVDPTWTPVSLYGQELRMVGFVEELLLEISRYSGLEFQRVGANWDDLFEGLRKDRYDAVLSSMGSHNFTEVSYDFSLPFYDAGPILVLPIDAKEMNLSKMKKALIGVLEDDPSALVLQSYPDLLMRTYPSATDLLEALAAGQIEAGILDRILAVNYVRDIYAQTLKATEKSLSPVPFRIVSPKGKNAREISLFNKSLQRLIKKGKLAELQKKWELAS